MGHITFFFTIPSVSLPTCQAFTQDDIEDNIFHIFVNMAEEQVILVDENDVQIGDRVTVKSGVQLTMPMIRPQAVIRASEPSSSFRLL